MIKENELTFSVSINIVLITGMYACHKKKGMSTMLRFFKEMSNFLNHQEDFGSQPLYFHLKQ